jgi:hypothetical protein
MMTLPFLKIAPGRLEVREGGGCMTLFGMPFLAAVLFMLLAAAGIVSLKTGQPIRDRRFLDGPSGEADRGPGRHVFSAPAAPRGSAERTSRAAGYLFSLLPIAVPVFFVGPFLQFFRQTKTPDVSAVFVAFLIGAFGVLPAYSALSAFLKSRRGRTTVTVTSAGMRLEERRVWKTRPLASFSASDILDIDYSTAGTIAEMQIRRTSMAGPPVGKGTELVLNAMRKLSSNGGVTIKTREGMTTFGDGLDDSEVRYLHYLVRPTLVQ